MNYILFDGPVRDSLLPFTFTRPVADIRVGILTLREKWEIMLGTTTTTLTEDYLGHKFPMVEMEENIMLNAAFLPIPQLAEMILNLKRHQAVFLGEDLIAFYAEKAKQNIDLNRYEAIEFEGELLKITQPWDIFTLNGEAIAQDYELLTHGRISQPLSPTNQVICPENIFLEEGAKVEMATLNASTGPIYLGKNAEIMEGSIIRGPFALCEGATVKMGAKIYGPTTAGPYCKLGGEVTNSILFGYSNKGHDGYLGNSVLGEWCNLGADTNTSNLKNDYSPVKMWDIAQGKFVQTGLQFCGLMMGDHSKCAINTMFNTGTVVGVFANIFGAGFPRNYIPSFSWGGPAGYKRYQLNKAFQVADAVLKRRGTDLSEEDKKILEHLYNQQE